MQRRFVIDRDLFAGLDVAQGYEENVIVEDLHEGVRRTGMVDVVSAVSAAASIKAPAIVDFTNTEHWPVSPAPGFGVRDLLTGIFSDFVSFFERDRGEAAPAVYRGRLDG